MSEKTSGDSIDFRNGHKTPKTPNELYDYFANLEDFNPVDFSGYANLTHEAVESIAEAVRYGKTDDEQSIDIALIPGRHEAIRTSFGDRHDGYDERTTASNALWVMLTEVYKLEPVADETTSENPYGRILWQNTEGTGINIIETRWNDTLSDLVKYTAVSHLPEGLLDTDRMVTETMGWIESIPVLQIDEAELVKAYFREAA
jgi:hypothetical protein